MLLWLLVMIIIIVVIFNLKTLKIIIIIFNIYMAQINIQEDIIKYALHVKIEYEITVLPFYNFEFKIKCEDVYYILYYSFKQCLKGVEIFLWL